MSCARSSDGPRCLTIQGSTVQVILFGLPDTSRRRQRHRIMRWKTRILRNTSVITSDVSSYWCALQNLKECRSSVTPAFRHQATWLLPARTACSAARHSPWKANWFAASQEIPRISRNPKVHYHTHKRPPPVSILVQPNPVHIPTSYLLKIHLNIIHPSTPRSPQWSPSLRFPHQDPIHPPLLTHTRHMPSPDQSTYHV